MPDLRLTGLREISIVLLIALVFAVAAHFVLPWGSEEPEVEPEAIEQQAQHSWPGRLQTIEDKNPGNVECQVSRQKIDNECSAVGCTDADDVDDFGALLLRVDSMLGIGGAALFEHTVRPGETPSEIARRYDVSVRVLASGNNLVDPDQITAGQTLLIPPDYGVYHRVRSGDTVWALAQRYDVSVQSIIDANDLSSAAVIYPGQEILITGSSSGGSARAAIASRGRRNFRWPLPVEGRISSPYGPRWGGFHYGVDIAASRGTPILASAGGEVVSAGYRGTYGLTVQLDHGGGYETVYAHADQIMIRLGDAVSAGETIAVVGSTGRSTGPHLHFEIRLKGEPRDPMPYLR